MTPGHTPWAAVVLAGGASRRMGRDKLAEAVSGAALLDRVLSAAAGATPIVAVGPRRRTAREVLWCREAPVGGGPAAALAAGLALCPPEVPLVALLGGDLPFVTAVVLRLLREELEADDAYGGVVVTDQDGREQTMLGVWRRGDLEAAVTAGGGAPGLSGTPLRRVLERIPHRGVPLVDSGIPAWMDCDTPADLAHARRLDAMRKEGHSPVQ